MRISPPKPFTFEEGEQAVLLLHGFTGTTNHMKMLGKYLHEKGYTVHAPLYKGHGLSAEELTKTTPEAWWESAYEGYKFLQNQGYKEITVCGISMGGVFACKLATLFPVKNLITMCAPMAKREKDSLMKRMLSYAKTYKEFEGKAAEVIQEEVKALEQMPFEALADFNDMVLETSKSLHRITAPTLIIQGCLDDHVYQASAEIIYEGVSSTHKTLKWYEESGHVITMDKEKMHVFEDVHTFLTQPKDH